MSFTYSKARIFVVTHLLHPLKLEELMPQGRNIRAVKRHAHLLRCEAF